MGAIARYYFCELCDAKDKSRQLPDKILKSFNYDPDPKSSIEEIDMNKNIAKTESVQEFLARGGKINKIQPKVNHKRYTKKVISNDDLEDADFSQLPASLKVRYGLK